MIYEVEYLDPEIGDWVYQGSVILPPKGATPGQVEHSLAPLGLYAPRGLDTIEWTSDGAVIREYGERETIRLGRVGEEASSTRGKGA